MRPVNWRPFALGKNLERFRWNTGPGSHLRRWERTFDFELPRGLKALSLGYVEWNASLSLPFLKYLKAMLLGGTGFIDLGGQCPSLRELEIVTYSLATYYHGRPGVVSYDRSTWIRENDNEDTLTLPGSLHSLSLPVEAKLVLKEGINYTPATIQITQGGDLPMLRCLTSESGFFLEKFWMPRLRYLSYLDPQINTLYVSFLEDSDEEKAQKTLLELKTKHEPNNLRSTRNLAVGDCLETLVLIPSQPLWKEILVNALHLRVLQLVGVIASIKDVPSGRLSKTTGLEMSNILNEPTFATNKLREVHIRADRSVAIDLSWMMPNLGPFIRTLVLDVQLTRPKIPPHVEFVKYVFLGQDESFVEAFANAREVYVGRLVANDTLKDASSVRVLRTHIFVPPSNFTTNHLGMLPNGLRKFYQRLVSVSDNNMSVPSSLKLFDGHRIFGKRFHYQEVPTIKIPGGELYTKGIVSDWKVVDSTDMHNQ